MEKMRELIVYPGCKHADYFKNADAILSFLTIA